MANGRKIAKDRNVSAANAKNKAAVAAANQVRAAEANKADDKPGYLGKGSGGRRLPPLCLSCVVSKDPVILQGENNSPLNLRDMKPVPSVLTLLPKGLLAGYA